MKRRARLRRLAVLLLVPLAAAGCRDLKREEHVLNRIGYGPDAWSVARIGALGVQGYIQEQLQPETIDDSAIESEVASRYPLTTWTLPEVRLHYNEYNTKQELLPGRVKLEMSWARMLRNVSSRRQLEQVLVDFWHNHFNVDARTESARWGVVTYEREALRPHVLGRFRDMLGAVAAHPSMLDYLDNAQSFIDGYMRGTTRFGLNENFARELLELHTLGVDAGYTLQDIREVARAFTGWTIDYYHPDGSFNYFASQFVYEDAGHDKGAKSILDLYIPPGGGMEDGQAVLDHLARHPSTARFVSRKLVQRFVAEDPPLELVDRAAATFLATDGDLREVMRTILLSPEFLDPRYRRAKVKRPQHFAASLARAVGVADRQLFAQVISGEVAKMGEELYAAGPPTGYPETSAYWMGEGPFVFRVNNALWAANGVNGFGPPVTSMATAYPETLVAELSGRLLRGGIQVTTIDRLVSLATQIPEAWRAPEVAAALLASPEFLVH